MLVTLNWLKDYVDIDCSPQDLANKLVGAGFEVEEIINLADNCKKVVVGQITQLEKHPDADKLQICQIDIGSQLVQIVTGANNINIGDLIPVALDGSDLPNGMHIKKGKLRGVPSNGMLCSGEELKLTENDYPGASVNGIMILKENYALGTDINTVLGNDDFVLDIGVTSNRPDCNSIIGIAREIATLLAKPLKQPNLTFDCCEESIETKLSVTVDNTTLCPRYMAGVVKDIVIKQSPQFIQKRLKAVGLRPINNIVDITNYVLIEIGQPMHAFDYNCLSSGKIIVRNAKDGEQIIALDSKAYSLDNTMLAICDNQKPSAIAGVMGGIESGIKETTDTLVFESAKFMRENIRRTSRKLNLRSDSSTRYERGIDFASQEIGLKRALALIDETKSGKIMRGVIDVVSGNLEPRILTTPTAKINEILGITVPNDKIVEILNSLQIQTVFENGEITCKIPLYREDIENANDLAEEVIRLYGYDNIICSLIDDGRQTQGGKTTQQKNIDCVKSILVGEGMNETYTYSFTSPKMYDTLLLQEDSELRKAVKLLNPLGEDLSIMRTTLAYDMLNVMSKNIQRSNKCGRLFEFANVYKPNSLPLTELPVESLHLILGIYGDGEDFYSLRGIVRNIISYFGLNEKYVRTQTSYLHKGIGADVIVGDTVVASLGEVHPNVAKKFDVKEKMYIAELNIELLNKLFDNSYKFEAIPKFPSVERDIAVVVDDIVSAEKMLECVCKACGKLLKDAFIFDIYKGKGIDKGYKSVAIKMIYQSLDKTLTEEEVNAKVQKALDKLAQDCNAKLR